MLRVLFLLCLISCVEAQLAESAYGCLNDRTGQYERNHRTHADDTAEEETNDTLHRIVQDAHRAELELVLHLKEKQRLQVIRGHTNICKLYESNTAADHDRD